MLHQDWSPPLNAPVAQPPGAKRRLAMGLLFLGGMGAGIGIDRLALELTEPDRALVDTGSFSVLEQTFDIIRDDYVLSGSVSDDQLVYGAAAGMVDSLGDTGHSRFLTPEEALQFDASANGQLIGIGINVEASELPLRVIMPIPGSPADHAGIMAGDVILAIDGTDVSQGSDPQVALDLLRGDEGTDLTVTVTHRGSAESVDLTMTRAVVTIDPVSWAMLPDGVLWARIEQFSRGATDDFKAALQAGSDRGARGLILDLRANPGGLVLEAMGVAGQLEPSGSVLFQREDASGNTIAVTTTGRTGTWQDRPIVVLIDDDSASAAEIVASSLGDNGRATLVGSTTSGTGTVLLPVELEDGSLVLIGTELWLTPNGSVIWHNGVQPDLPIENPPGSHLALPATFGQELSAREVQDSGDRQLAMALSVMSPLLLELSASPLASPATKEARPVASSTMPPVPEIATPESRPAQ